jgi:hypothetical protein
MPCLGNPFANLADVDTHSGVYASTASLATCDAGARKHLLRHKPKEQYEY